MRLALIVSAAGVPRFLAEALDEVHAQHAWTVAAIVKIDAPRPTASPLFRAYQRMDRRRAQPDDPLAIVPVEAGEVHTIRLSSAGRTLEPRDLPSTAGPIDLWLNVAGIAVSPLLPAMARFGVWTLRPAADPAVTGCLHELLERRTTTTIEISAEAPDGTQAALYVGSVATAAGISQVANRRQPFWAASRAIARLLGDLAAGGEEWIASAVKRVETASGPHREPAPRNLRPAPRAGAMMRWLLPEVIARTRRRLTRRPGAVRWDLAIRIDGPALPDTGGFRILPSPTGHFYADPFLIAHEGRTWLFFEDFEYRTHRGRICAAEISDAGDIGPPLAVLERPYHLSYPCLVEDAGALYMIPESKANATVDLYRCRTFPDRWEHLRTLATGRFVDTTVCRRGNRWWFFTTRVEPHAASTELWLYSAERIDDAWAPHPANPISTDVTAARGAGAILATGHGLWRPSQNCGPGYGYSFTLNAITRLDEEAYEERPVLTVVPDWAPGLIGTHSYSRLGCIEVIDAATIETPAARHGGRVQHDPIGGAK